MTAEEYIVEKIKELEKSIAILNAELEGSKKKLKEYETLVDALSRRISVTRYGVNFDFKNYEIEQKADIDNTLHKFFDLTEKES